MYRRPLLDRELGVLHVPVVALQRPQDLHSSAWASGIQSRQLGQVARRAHAGDDVLALRVEQEVAARLGRAGDLVARERHAGAPTSAPWLPKTICCTLTAVPQSSGMPLMRR